jgi:large subunit ribosomal protein L18
MVAHAKVIQKQRLRRKRRVRKLLKGSAAQPRLSVFRSNKHLYCQIIDDVARKTLASASTRDKDLRGGLKATSNKDAAAGIGKAIAEKALAAGIDSVCFDRGPYKYHGRVEALAAAAREAGLKF